MVGVVYAGTVRGTAKEANTEGAEVGRRDTRSQDEARRRDTAHDNLRRAAQLIMGHPARRFY
jgi:hypothetical protein